MSRFRCTLSAFVLVCLMAGSVQALPARSALALPEAGSRLDAAFEWLTGLLRPAEPRTTRQEGKQPRKYGCGMDPDGKPMSCSN
jgi:hypothetical protein